MRRGTPHGGHVGWGTGLPAGAPRKAHCPSRPWRPPGALRHLGDLQHRRRTCPHGVLLSADPACRGWRP
eukprot:1211161-Pyramimonas_sp.AAC.1